MTRLIWIAALLVSPAISHAEAVQALRGAQSEHVAHGGGCRKDSPRGQCCHAGSKPLHCH